MSSRARAFTSDREAYALPFESCLLGPRGRGTWPIIHERLHTRGTVLPPGTTPAKPALSPTRAPAALARRKSPAAPPIRIPSPHPRRNIV